MNIENEIYRLARERLVPMQTTCHSAKALHQRFVRNTDEYRKHHKEYMRKWRKSQHFIENKERYNEKHRIYMRALRKKRRAEKTETEDQ